jgi:hypothetical protein
MTTQEAQRIGSTKTLIAISIVVALVFFLFLLVQTNGDFANGVLFFMDAILNMHVFAVMFILFGFAYFLGGKAGKETILDKKHFVIVAIKYSLLIIFPIILYGLIINAIKMQKNWSSFFSSFISRDTLEFLSLGFIFLLAAWVTATYLMMRTGLKLQESRNETSK